MRYRAKTHTLKATVFSLAIAFTTLSGESQALAGFEFIPAMDAAREQTPEIPRLSEIRPQVDNPTAPVVVEPEPSARLEAPIMPSIPAQQQNFGTARLSEVEQEPITSAPPADMQTSTRPLPLTNANFDGGVSQSMDRPSVIRPQGAPLGIYSEPTVYGGAFSQDRFARAQTQMPQRETKSGFREMFSINPFPFGKGKKDERAEQAVLFGRPVPTSPDGPAPIDYASGIYPNEGFAVSPQPLNPSMMGAARYETAVGFGNDMPVEIAAQQIVPDDYQISYDSSVSKTTAISWEGGKPWNEVLTQALAQQGLAATIRGRNVEITTQQQAARAETAQKSASFSTARKPMRPQPLSGGNNSMMYRASAAPQPISHASAQGYRSPYFQNAQASIGGGNAGGQADYNTVRLWTAPRNATLKNILEVWSREANVDLYWSSEYDYPIQTDINIRGSYKEAVQTLLLGLSEAQPRPTGRFHPNLPDGPAVLVVRTRHIIR